MNQLAIFGKFCRLLDFPIPVIVVEWKIDFPASSALPRLHPSS